MIWAVSWSIRHKKTRLSESQLRVLRYIIKYLRYVCVLCHFDTHRVSEVRMFQRLTHSDTIFGVHLQHFSKQIKPYGWNEGEYWEKERAIKQRKNKSDLTEFRDISGTHNCLQRTSLPQHLFANPLTSLQEKRNKNNWKEYGTKIEWTEISIKSKRVRH